MEPLAISSGDSIKVYMQPYGSEIGVLIQDRAPVGIQINQHGEFVFIPYSAIKKVTRNYGS